MGLSALETGKRALIAQRFGLDVTSNNIANANTEGYSRRAVSYSQSESLYTAGNFIGTGVLVQKMRSFREDFFDREVRNTFARQSAFLQDEKTLERIEVIMSEPTESGLNDDITKFFTIFDELALKPESLGLRDHALSLAQTVVDKFNRIGQQLKDARQEVKKELDDITGNTNRLTREIANLNLAFSANKSLSTDQSQTMFDTRAIRLEELSLNSDITVSNNEDGTVNVAMNGINVVTRNIATELEIAEEIAIPLPAPGQDPNEIESETSYKLVKRGSDGRILNTIEPDNGKFASLLKNINITLDGQDTTGEFSVFTKINQFAAKFVENVNDLTMQGYGMDDNGETPPGLNFFEPNIEGVKATALTIAINKDLKNNPRKLPLSDMPGTVGNTAIARKIARLANKFDFIEDSTYTEFYSDLIGKIGSISQEAKKSRETTDLITDQLSNQRDAIMGVNLDEEAINLIKFQQSFQAASRVVNSVDEILRTIINLGL